MTSFLFLHVLCGVTLAIGHFRGLPAQQSESCHGYMCRPGTERVGRKRSLECLGRILNGLRDTHVYARQEVPSSSHCNSTIAGPAADSKPGRFLPDTVRRWLLARCGAAVASCPVRRGGGFLPAAARRWLLARCCAAMASCPLRRGGGYLPDAARRWLLARCCAAVVICRRMYCARIARVEGC